MSIKIPQAKIYKTFSTANLKKQFKPANILSAMASDGFLPVIALEAFVEAGRTYQAYKRGGFDEARERITEEFSGAVFWLGGVTGLNWVFEKLGQKILKLPNKTVDIAKDDVRNPLENFLQKETKTNGAQISHKTMARFKFAKVAASVILANAFIGFALPKINQAITRWYHKKNNTTQQTQSKPDNFIKRPKMNDFGQNKKDINFGSGLNLLSIANKLENDRNWKLLSVDAGTCSGRVYSARNNDERVEIGFRDIASIYFYMFNMPNINSWLNQLEQGKGNKTRLDTSSAEFVTEYMQNYLDTKPDKKVNFDDFFKEFIGSNREITDHVLNIFKDKKVVTLEEFKDTIRELVDAQDFDNIEKIAQKFAQLQPELNGEKIIAQSQIREILNYGHLNNPEFLKEFYKNALGGNKFMDSFRFISQNSLDNLRKDLRTYVESIYNMAKETEAKEITSEILKKALKHNFRMNALNWGTGFAISAAFLSTFIPKIQYWITKFRTGQDNFPGTKEFREN